MSGVEIFGIAVAAIQLAELGSRLSVKLCRLCDRAKHGDTALQGLSKDVALTCNVMRQLGDSLQRDDHARLCTPDAFSTAQDVLNECQNVFRKIDETICLPGKGARKSSFHRAARVFGEAAREPRLNALSDNLDKLKSTMILMLNVIIYAGQIRSRSSYQPTLAAVPTATDAFKSPSSQRLSKARESPDELERYYHLVKTFLEDINQMQAHLDQHRHRRIRNGVIKVHREEEIHLQQEFGDRAITRFLDPLFELGESHYEIQNSKNLEYDVPHRLPTSNGVVNADSTVKTCFPDRQAMYRSKRISARSDTDDTIALPGRAFNHEVKHFGSRPTSSTIQRGEESKNAPPNSTKVTTKDPCRKHGGNFGQRTPNSRSVGDGDSSYQRGSGKRFRNFFEKKRHTLDARQSYQGVTLPGLHVSPAVSSQHCPYRSRENNCSDQFCSNISPTSDKVLTQNDPAPGGEKYVFVTIDQVDYHLVDVTNVTSMDMLRATICHKVGISHWVDARLFLTAPGQTDHDDALSDTDLAFCWESKSLMQGSLQLLVRDCSSLSANLARNVGLGISFSDRFTSPASDLHQVYRKAIDKESLERTQIVSKASHDSNKSKTPYRKTEVIDFDPVRLLSRVSEASDYSVPPLPPGETMALTKVSLLAKGQVFCGSGMSSSSLGSEVGSTGPVGGGSRGRTDKTQFSSQPGTGHSKERGSAGHFYQSPESSAMDESPIVSRTSFGPGFKFSETVSCPRRRSLDDESDDDLSQPPPELHRPISREPYSAEFGTSISLDDPNSPSSGPMVPQEEGQNTPCPICAREEKIVDSSTASDTGSTDSGFSLDLSARKHTLFPADNSFDSHVLRWTTVTVEEIEKCATYPEDFETSPLLFSDAY